jgi:hypothetical protein
MEYQVNYESEHVTIVTVYSAGNVTWKMKMKTVDLWSRRDSEQREAIRDHMMKACFHVNCMSRVDSPMPFITMVENGLEIMNPIRKKRGTK